MSCELNNATGKEYPLTQEPSAVNLFTKLFAVSYQSVPVAGALGAVAPEKALADQFKFLPFVTTNASIAPPVFVYPQI